MNGYLRAVSKRDILAEVDAADSHLVRVFEELVEVLVGDG